MKKTLFEDVLILSLVKTAQALVRLLPLGVCVRGARVLGVAVYFLSKRRRIAYKNLRAAFAGEKSRREMKRIARVSMENLVASAVELLKAPDLDRAYVDRHVRIDGKERFEPYLQQGRGLIFLTAHLGSWEFLNITASILNYPMVALARVQKHPRSDAFLNELRTSKGSQVIHKGMPIREALRSLRRGKILGILSDQDGGKNGCFVRFFGRLSSTPTGVATFAMRTGAPIFPALVHRENLVDHVVEVEGPLRMPENEDDPRRAEHFVLQQFADVLEAKIRKYPDQWLWAHRRWKSSPDRSVLILSDGKAGHLNQSLAFFAAYREEKRARGQSDDTLKLAVIEVLFKSGLHRRFLAGLTLLTRGRLPFKHTLMKFVLVDECYDTVMKTYADVVVSCGSSLSGLNLLVTYENQARSVLLMNPPVPSARFDAVIVPGHDEPRRASNVFVTEGPPVMISEAVLSEEAEKLSTELRIPEGRRIGFLIGGDTESLKFEPVVVENMIGQMKRLMKEMNALIFVTSSRRTPPWADTLLKQAFEREERCPLLVIANEANRNGVVKGILGLCELVVVTGESMSMLSEAVASGKRVVALLPVKEASLKKKHRAFLRQMQASGRLGTAEAENLCDSVRGQLLTTAVDHRNGSSDKNLQALREAARRLL